MDFYQFFMNPEKLDIERLKRFFESYNLNSNLIGIDYVEEKIDEYYFTFCCNETFCLDTYPFEKVNMFFDEDIDETEKVKETVTDGQKLKDVLGQKCESKEGTVYKTYFTMGNDCNCEEDNGDVVYLSRDDVALYTYVYALYLSKYHNGVLYYSNSGIFVTEDILEELIDRGLNKDLKFAGLYIIDKKQYEMDVNYYKDKADNGNVAYQVKLGYLYEKNHDMENAIKYYKMAADNGEPVGQFNLGVVYSKCNDIKNAEKYYKMAADNGKTSAQFNLGILYEEKNDIKNAMKYYKMAADNGDAEAKSIFEELYKSSNC